MSPYPSGMEFVVAGCILDFRTLLPLIANQTEHGCEIQNTACGQSGIMLLLKLVSAANDDGDRAYEGPILHGTAVLRRLVEPWAGTQRIVCANSYFASREAPDEIG